MYFEILTMAILILVTYKLREGNFEFKRMHSNESNKNKKYPDFFSSVLYIIVYIKLSPSCVHFPQIFVKSGFITLNSHMK